LGKPPSANNIRPGGGYKYFPHILQGEKSDKKTRGIDTACLFLNFMPGQMIAGV
jgi:hypothetical protein